jgi:apolipoprotein N-acyltransferase
MLRATNTGITAAIDAWGRVQARLPMNVAGVLRVAVVPTTGTTLYTRLGDAPLVGAYAIVLVGALLETVRARRRPSL